MSRLPRKVIPGLLLGSALLSQAAFHQMDNSFSCHFNCISASSWNEPGVKNRKYSWWDIVRSSETVSGYSVVVFLVAMTCVSVHFCCAHLRICLSDTRRCWIEIPWQTQHWRNTYKHILWHCCYAASHNDFNSLTGSSKSFALHCCIGVLTIV